MVIETSYQRRKESRYSVGMSGELRPVATDSDSASPSVVCDLQNLSRHGACFEASSNTCLAGKEADIRLTLPGGAVAMATAKIVRQEGLPGNRSRYGAILRFERETDRRKTHAFIRSVGNEAIQERRAGDRRTGGGNREPECRKKDRRQRFGIFRESASFATRAPEWKATYTIFRRSEATSAARIIVNGRELISFGTNDYLGLSHDPRVREAAIKAIGQYGTSAGSRVLNGTLGLHEELEHEIAEFKGADAGLVFGGGYLANVAILTALLKEDDRVFLDEKAHVSIIDGCLFSRARIIPFRHNAIEDLERKIQRLRTERSLIIVDGVYSIEGDLARLPEIYALAVTHNIPTMVDDAHGFGVMGARGSGTSEHFHLEGQIDLDMGTLSGVLGGIGGFVVCKQYIADYLRHFSKGFLFTTSLPPATTAGLVEALRIVRREPFLRERLWKNVNKLRAGLTGLGYKISETESAILSILIGNEQDTYRIVRQLEERGVYVSSFIRPAVKRGEARVRVTVSAAHSEEDIMLLLSAFRDLKPTVDSVIKANG